MRSLDFAGVKGLWKSVGETKTAWVADYFDQHGTRRLKSFKIKKDADAWLVQARGQVARGTHTADTASATVADAADRWLARCERDNLEQSTMVGYRSHVTYHIKPPLGSTKLSRLTGPRVQEFIDELLNGGRSRALTKKVVGVVTCRRTRAAT
jgi:integrase